MRENPVEVKEKLYKMKEASSLLGVHPNTIRRWSKEGRIRVMRIGRGHRKIPQSEINRILHGTAPAPPEIPTSAEDEKLSFLNFVFLHHRDDWDLVKKAVIIRDDYACQECGGQEMLEVHHKDGSGRNDPENLTTLCRKCHQKKHAQPTPVVEKPKIQREKLVLAPKKPIEEKIQPPTRPSELPRTTILEALAPTAAQRAAFGEILSVAALFKKFTTHDLVSKARCPEVVAKIFCKQMERLGYLKSSNGTFELTVKVI